MQPAQSYSTLKSTYQPWAGVRCVVCVDKALDYQEVTPGTTIKSRTQAGRQRSHQSPVSRALQDVRGRWEGWRGQETKQKNKNKTLQCGWLEGMQKQLHSNVIYRLPDAPSANMDIAVASCRRSLSADPYIEGYIYPSRSLSS